MNAKLHVKISVRMSSVCQRVHSADLLKELIVVQKMIPAQKSRKEFPISVNGHEVYVLFYKTDLIDSTDPMSPQIIEEDIPWE